MQPKVLVDENLIRKRAALTKWFFFVLLFNIGLQFDFVEEYFNSSSSKSKVIAQNVDICGSSSSVGAPAPNEESIQLASISGITSTNSFQTKTFISSKNSLLNGSNKNPKFKNNERTCPLELFASEFSGLSPPKV